LFGKYKAHNKAGNGNEGKGAHTNFITLPHNLFKLKRGHKSLPEEAQDKLVYAVQAYQEVGNALLKLVYPFAYGRFGALCGIH
jgi:hypothetical protein